MSNLNDPSEPPMMSQMSVHAALGQCPQLKASLEAHREPNLLDPDSDRRPLHWAAARGHPRCIELLLEHGADPELPDKAGNTALSLAERCGNETCAFLLRHGPPIEDPKRITHHSALGAASLQAALGHAMQLKHYLYLSTATPNARDRDGDRTPLHWAAARGHLRCAQLLIKKGADLDATDADGHTGMRQRPHTCHDARRPRAFINPRCYLYACLSRRWLLHCAML